MIQQLSRHNRLFLQILLVCIVFTPISVHAQGYVSLSGITGLAPATPDFEGFVETVMRMAIVAAALIAVIKLILAGAKYVLSGIVTDKENAKADIRAALTGLIIILISVVILRTINPKLANLPSLPPAPDLGIIIPDHTGGAGGAHSIIDGTINISEGSPEEIVAYQRECAIRRGSYTQIELASGEIVGHCNTTRAVDQITTTNPAEAEAQRQYCNNNDQLYTDTILNTRETQITCGQTCQNGVVPNENRCSDTPINPEGDVTYQCDINASDYENCRTHCSSSGGSIDADGLCTGASDSYFN